MSTVCYCGRPDCSVTSMARDTCLTALRTERDALRAQVEAARRQCAESYERHENPAASEDYREGYNDALRNVLDAMDEAK